MRAVVQRVSSASVRIEGEVVGSIQRGLMVLLAAGQRDTDADLDTMVRRIPDLRIFDDADGRMNLSLLDTGGSLLVVSQFTLYGDCRKGRRPSFVGAMAPDTARTLVDRAVEAWRARGIAVETGRFGATMEVALVNDGPVTLLIDTEKSF
jgi:D-tyrosyl-tRNA(Tyr) deacylase